VVELLLAAAFKAWLVAPTHRPRVNRPWPIAIHATDLAGHPIRARVTMRLLFGGIPVGKVDDGKVWTFKGVWREPKGQEIRFPATSRGQRLIFQALVTARGKTIKLNFWVQPR
jgi:hypothetical protein